MMRETKRSISQYLGIVAIASIVLGSISAYQSMAVPLFMGMSIVTVCFGILYLYLAVQFSNLFPAKAKLIKQVLTANLIYSILQFVIIKLVQNLFVIIKLVQNLQPNLLSLIITAAIYFYLVKNIDRLVAEDNTQSA